MSHKPVSIALLAVMLASAAGSLPELRTEAVSGGSVFYVKNGSGQPLTAYLIELVDYPGSSYWLFQDDVAAPIAAGATKRIPVSNMIVGAAPEYVKITAALYADGSSAGAPEKIARLLEWRKSTLDATREAIRRLEQAKQAGTAKPAVMADLRQWSASVQPQGKTNRLTPTTVNQWATRGAVSRAAGYLEQHSIEDTLADLRATEQSMATAKP